MSSEAGLRARLRYEPRQGLASCSSIQSVGSVSELDAVKEALDIACNCIRSHDEDAVNRVDVLARNRSRRMADECSNRAFCEAKIIRRAGEAMPKNVGGKIGNPGSAKDPVPMVWKASKGL